MKVFTNPRIAGEGREILFLHGWSAHGDFFAPQLPLAGEGFRLAMPDLPGHGPDGGRHPELTITALADSLHHWLGGAGAASTGARPILVGWSMGAFVALDYLRRYGSGRVAGLMMIDMTARVSNTADWRLGLASGQSAGDMIAQSQEMALDWPRFSTRVARAIFARNLPPDPEMLRWTQAAMAANDGVTMAALWRDLARADFRETLHTLDIPLNIALGARSRIYGPELGDWYAAGGFAVARFAQSGHAPHLEEAAAFNRLLAAFARVIPG
jgi:pimeloyl-[acyl-carrier protein] methyl ester esterase